MSNKRGFKVGDKVEFEKGGVSRVGTIDEIDNTWAQSILVYSKGMCGHNASSSLKGSRKTKEYWWFSPIQLRLKKNECIVIYRKGQEVIALDKATGKKAIAKCSPEDEFDFNIGSKLAFERLLGIEEQKEAKPEFLEKFEKGKIYVFRKELHDKYLPERANSTWTKDTDGKIVNFTRTYIGEIGSYSIVPEWCEEIGYKKEGADNE